MWVEFGPVGCSLEALWASDGAINPMAGARGGAAGGCAAQFLRSEDGSLEALDVTGPIVVAPGQRLVACTNGGGGYGDPKEREREAVERDLAEGWITATRAAEVYGLLSAPSPTEN